jgi:hypothetical protein
MQSKIFFLLIAAAVSLIACASSRAAPMRCTGEGQACIAACGKMGDRIAAANCVTNCRARQSDCVHSGCWVNGPSRICGLLRQ